MGCKKQSAGRYTRMTRKVLDSVNNPDGALPLFIGGGDQLCW